MGGQNLDGYFAPETRIARKIHFAHAASTKRPVNLVWSEPTMSGHAHTFTGLYLSGSTSKVLPGDPGESSQVRS